MKKQIVIDSDEAEIKKVEKNVRKKPQPVSNEAFDWLIYMIGYGLVLIIASRLFKSLYINLDHSGIYALIAAIIIYFLNETVKPIIKVITLPLTIISWGLLYPISNVIILYITSLILGKNFIISGFIAPFIIAVFISLLNIIVEGLLIKPIINKRKKSS